MFCSKCGKEMPEGARFCPGCGGLATVGNAATAPDGSCRRQDPGKSRISYVLLGIFLGCLGVHNFYAGYTGRAVTQLLITLLLGWLIIPWLVVYIWCIVEVCTVRMDGRGNYFVA